MILEQMNDIIVLFREDRSGKYIQKTVDKDGSTSSKAVMRLMYHNI